MPENDDVRRTIRRLPRERVVAILERAGFACYSSESDDKLEEALAVNIEDGTIDRAELELD